ncbi:MAG: RNA polymerase sigma factor SigW [Candidatus Ozemobacter sibiricus]|uniref:RNA polymerase sigma factor SigW n=1 Tax=Candidatus Ozemobacter sibiricus TaxID=2268124 RepID=A0A367ZNN6_9BACT|nr:MAG: RNA polymerase sigma factor SigW [Candidatus Ozemobacter sibiricus]
MPSASHETEAELIRQVRAGRREAFRPLVERYWPRVKSLARRILRGPELVEDICQETFLRAYEKLETFDLTRDFGPWIARIAVNLIGEHFRRHGQKWQLVPLDERLFQPGLEDEPSDTIVGRVLLDDCLMRLPLALRLVFILRHGLMFRYEEIAQILEEPVGTIKVHLFRAREMLKTFWTRVPVAQRATERERVE